MNRRQEALSDLDEALKLATTARHGSLAVKKHVVADNFDQAVDWLTRTKPHDQKLVRLRAEATKLMGIDLNLPSTEKKTE